MLLIELIMANSMEHTMARSKVLIWIPMHGLASSCKRSCLLNLSVAKAISRERAALDRFSVAPLCFAILYPAPHGVTLS